MNINKTLLERYFSGACSPVEERAVLDYLTNGNSDLSVLHQMLIEAQRNVEPQSLPASLQRSLIAGLRRETFPGFLEQARVINHKWWYTAATAAAAVLLPAIFLFTFYFSEKERARVSDSAVQNEWKTIVNLSNHTRKAVLPDGTSIWLSPGSNFRFSSQLFAKSSRVIKLEGEAFFQVAADTRHPFIVQHGAISTHVLGTAFNVEAYKNEPEIRVSLLTGKVAIKSTGDTMLNHPLQYLAPGQQLIYQNRNGAIDIKPLLYVQESTWTKGWMVLDDVSLDAALKRLEHQYQLHIHIEAGIDISGKRVTAIFKESTVQEILHSMLFAHHLRFEQKDTFITIRTAD